MKTKYRVLSMLLCMVMLLTMLPVGAMAAEGMGNFKLSKTYADTFTDVSADDWFYNNVKNAYEYGLMKGNSASIFNPNGNMTLAETITVAARLHAIYHTGKESFSSSDPWYKTYVDYCMKNEIIEAAYSDYDAPATRAQFAVILAAALPNAALKEINDVDDKAIPDVDMDADYAKAVYKLYRAGVLIGNDAQGTFAPQSAIRRSEVAAIVSRMADPYLRESVDLSAPGGGIAGTFPSFGGGSGKTYTVTFDANGNDVENLPAPQRVRAGQCADEPSAPTKVIHEFDGWYTDSGCTAAFDFDEPINKDTTLYAKWDITIYSKDLDPDHVKTGTLTFEGEEYEGQYIDNELIVVVKDSAVREDVEKLVAPYGGAVVGQIPKAGCYQVEFDTAKTVYELNSVISSLTIPESVSLYLNCVSEYTPNAYYPNDLTGRPVFAEYGEFYHVSWETALWGQSACNVPQAWELVKSVNDNPTIRLGFIDETFDANHEDLSIIEAYCHGDAFNPYTVAEKDLAVAEHGTHVAGIMGAQSDNGIGISGVALNAKLYGTAVKTKLVGITIAACDFAIAKDYAIMIEVCTNGGKEPTVINTSFGQEGKDGINPFVMNGARVLIESIAVYHNLGYKFLLIQAAGNDGTDEKDDTNYNSIAACVSENWLKDQIIVVGNAANAGLGYGYYRAKTSSYKGGRVDVMAPGTDIFSTMPKNSYSKESSDGSAMNGTSMAAPFVAGLAGLIWEANPNLSAERVKEIIVQTANIDVADSEANMVNAEEAVLEALGHDPRTKDVTLKFVDTATNSYLTCNNVTAKVVSYTGSGDRENLFDEREIGLIHMSFTNGKQSHSQGHITLPYGTYEMKFSAEGYQDTMLDWDDIQDAEFVVDDDTEEIIISMTPVGTTPPDEPVSGKTLHVNFVDSATNLPVALSDIFPEDAEIGLGRSTTEKEVPEVTMSVFETAGQTDTKLSIPNIPELELSEWQGTMEPWGNYQLYFNCSEVSYELPDTSDYPYTIGSAGLSEDNKGDYVVTLKLKKHYIKVENVTVTEANAADILGDGTAAYDYSTNTLTLKNATLCETEDYKSVSAIESNLPVIVLNIPAGTNSYLYSSYTEAINGKKLSITGKGTLSVCGDPDYYAIRGNEVHIEDATIVFDDTSGGISCKTFAADGATIRNSGIYGWWSLVANEITISNTTIDITGLSSSIEAKGGDIRINNSNITLYNTSDDLWYAYLLFAESGTMYIDAASTVNLVTPHANTDEDLELLCATNGFVLDRGLTIRSSGGKTCEIYQPEEGRNYSVRCTDGTYPKQVFVAPRSEAVPAIRTVAVPEAIKITDVDYIWYAYISGGGEFKLTGTFEVLNGIYPSVTTSWGDTVKLKRISGSEYEFTINVWGTWMDSDMNDGDTMGDIIITAGSKSKEITVVVNGTFDVSFLY